MRSPDLEGEAIEFKSNDILVIPPAAEGEIIELTSGAKLLYKEDGNHGILTAWRVLI